MPRRLAAINLGMLVCHSVHCAWYARVCMVCCYASVGMVCKLWHTIHTVAYQNATVDGMLA